MQTPRSYAIAARLELLKILKTLTDAYSSQQIEVDTLQVYLDNLKDIPSWLLELAVARHLRASAWFPKLSELRELAEKIAGLSDFTALDPLPPDLLSREELELEAAFYHQDHLDPHEWEWLAVRFERAGRPHRAQAARAKFQGRLQILTGKLAQVASDLEDAFFHESRLDPAEWERLAVQFEHLDRPYRADYTREKLRRLQIVRQRQACTTQIPPIEIYG
jgi:hypothetical protein